MFPASTVLHLSRSLPIFWGASALVAIGILATLGSCRVYAQEREDNSSLEQAIELYTEGLEISSRTKRLDTFSKSHQLFQQAIEQNENVGKPVTAELFVALGNAALQAEHIGPAIASFRRAMAADPSHSQASQNLIYARSTVPDWIQYDSTESLADTLFFWQSIYSRHAINLFAALIFLIGASVLAFAIARRSRLLRNLAFIPIAAWLLLILTQTTTHNSDTSPNAVVVAEECILRAADSANAPARLNQPLPSGSELTVVSSRDRWSEVSVNGRTGWVLTSALDILRTP